MQVNIYGAKNRSLTNFLRKSIYFFARKLLTYQILPYIHIKVVIKKELDDDYLGTCIYIDDELKPREFLIEIKYTDTETMLETLAHEMVHLKQFVKGQLKERYMNGKRLTFWCNKPMRRPYWNQPWEKEAFCMQVFLKESFLEEYRGIKCHKSILV